MPARASVTASSDLGQRGWQVALKEAEPVERREGVGRQSVIAEAAGDRDRLGCHRGDVRPTVEMSQQLGGRDEREGQRAGGPAGIGAGEQSAQRLDDLAAVAAGEDERPQRCGQPQAGLGAVRVGDAERERGPDVVEFGLEGV